MTFSKIGRILSALVATAALGLGMTACGGGTIGYMWVLGTYYNQISGFKIDDYTGNLTVINHSPFSSGGANPQSVVVKPGGRYLYVINSGVCPGTPAPARCTNPTGSGVAEFAIGGDGILTYQQTYFSQGANPLYGAIDSSGNYLYVLDAYSPYYNGTTDTNGSITVFSIASDTGRLTLVPNTSILQTGTQIPTTVFEVIPSPVMIKTGLGGCLFTLGPNSIYPYATNAGTGQLTISQTGPYSVTGSGSLSSINTGGNGASNFIYVTDQTKNQIFSLQSASSSVACSLGPIAGSQQSNVSGALNPVYSITSSSGKYLYVLNQSSTLVNGTSNSTISAFTINSLGQLQTLSDATNNPYAVGSGPVCAVQDPTNQYLYFSNNTDSTLTGKLLDQNRGFLSDLSRGSVFPTTKSPTCLAVSGAY